MSNTPHELAEEFPEYIDKLHALKASTPHFAKMMDEYHDVNRAIHRAETNIEPVGDMHMETMRKNRLALKDQIFGMLTGA